MFQQPEDATTSEHIVETHFELYLTGSLSKEPEYSFENHLEQCTNCAAKLSEMDLQLRLSVPLRSKGGHPERRSEHRFDAQGSAMLQILSPFSAKLYEAMVVNASKHGLRLLVSAPLIPRSLVKVRLKNFVVFADVRHVTATANGSMVGLRLHVYP